MRARIWQPEPEQVKSAEGKHYLLQLGDSLKLMRQLPDNSIDSICTDGPYGLEFRGAKWDSFGAGIEKDAKSAGGFGKDAKTNENAYGAARVRHGNMNKHWTERPAKDKLRAEGRNRATDKPLPLYTAGYAFQQWSQEWAEEALRILKPGGYLLSFGGTRTHHRMVCGVEDAGFEIRGEISYHYNSGFPKSHDFTKAGGNKFAAKWKGWGTSTKPAHECICLARKPLSERTVADNVMRWGVGGLNINACRIMPNNAAKLKKNWDRETTNDIRGGNLVNGKSNSIALATEAPEGRWPSDMIFGHSEGCTDTDCIKGCVVDELGYMKEFYFCPKPSKREKDLGLNSLDEKQRVFWQTGNGTSGKASSISEGRNTTGKNTHPTCKPVELMRYLLRLVTPPGGRTLDHFMGSGTTGVAAVEEGFYFLGFEQYSEYFELARLRCRHAEKQLPALKNL